jgi:5-hydroxyisourate hydrolase-like protein (transthyretin family)
MLRRAALAALLLPVLGALLALLFTRREPHRQLPELPRAWKELEERAARERGGAGPQETEPVEQGPEPRFEDSSERTALEARPAAERDRLRAEVVALVVDAASGAPVEGVTVRLVAVGTSRAPFDPGRWFRAASAAALREHALESAATDAAGKARFAARAGDGLLLAQTEDGRVGTAVARLDGREPARLELVRDFDVFSRVVDSAGRPVAGADVVLRRQAGVVHNDYALVATDADGQARLEGVGRIAARRSGRWRVQLALATGEALGAEIDAKCPPQGPLELVLPPCGSVEVQLVDRDGSPLLAPLNVLLRSTADGDWRGVAGRFATAGSTTRRPCVAGRVVFEHVALGAQLIAVGAGGAFVASTEFEGPATPGERVRVELRGFGAHTWTGRVLDERGRLWRGSLAVRADDVAAQGQRMLDSELTPDADGRFRLEVDSAASLTEPIELTFAALDAAGRELAAGHAYVRQLDVPEELGDIVVAPVAPLASGTVVDWSGKPVVSARVNLVENAIETYPSTRWPFEAYTDERGRFELRFALDDERVALQATLGPRVSPAVEVPRGARDVRLVLPWRGVVRGRLVRDPDVREMHVVARVVPAGVAVDDLEARRLNPADDGSFQIVGLPEGACDLVFGCALGSRSSPEVLRLPHALVLTRERPLAELGDLDIAALLRPIRITAVDERGGELERGWVEVVGHSSAVADIEEAQGSNRSSSIALPGVIAPFEVLARGPEHFSVRARVTESAELRLSPSPRITLRLARSTPPLPSGIVYSAAWVREALAPPLGSSDYFDGDGVWSSHPENSGEARIALFVQSGLRHDERGRALPQTCWPKLEVRAGEDRELAVEVPAAEVEAALRELLAELRGER